MLFRSVYQGAGQNGLLASLEPLQFELPNVTAEEMVRLYDQKMVARRSPGRAIYDNLRLAPRNGRCPLCGHREVMTLDHYLPKASFSALAVNPTNLVPACWDCNRAKLASVVATLHPYFDDVENDRWLYARVVERTPAVVEYFVESPDEWPEGLALRVREHFNLYKIADLYSAQAARILSGIRLRLADAYHNGGPESVKQHVSEDARSWQASDINGWEAVLYEALSESEWFCETGFRLGEG